MKDFTNSGINHIIDSPNYSAHKTNTKFFKTIEQSKFLGAQGPYYTPGQAYTRGSTPTSGTKHFAPRYANMWESKDNLNEATEEILPPNVSKI